MKVKTHSIVKGSEADLSGIVLLFAKVADQLLTQGNPMWSGTYPNEKDFAEDIALGRLYVMKENGKVIGSASITHDVAEGFFPETLSERKSNELLDKIGYRGEPISILHRFAIDPAYQGHGLGGEFLQSLFARYKESTWVFAVYEKNPRALAFYLKHGFSSLGLYEGLEYGEFSNQYVVYKTYKKQGLCSNPWW